MILPQYVPNNVIIKFATSTSLSNYDRLFIDNLQIEFETGSAGINPPPPTEITLTPQIILDEFSQISLKTMTAQ